MSKKYFVKLTNQEIKKLETLIKKNQSKMQSINSAQILLMASDGKTDKEIADFLRIHISIVEHTCKKYVSKGIEEILKEPYYLQEKVKLKKIIKHLSDSKNIY